MVRYRSVFDRMHGIMAPKPWVGLFIPLRHVFKGALLKIVTLHL
jgi:hypothetical protein